MRYSEHGLAGLADEERPGLSGRPFTTMTTCSFLALAHAGKDGDRGGAALDHGGVG